MQYKLSKKYENDYYLGKIMGPNPLKLLEELLNNNYLKENAIVCDLGSGNGLTSIFLVKEYNVFVYATDLWSEPKENEKFFNEVGLNSKQIIPIKADANSLPFSKNSLDALVCVDSYNYFGYDIDFLDSKILPFIKDDGYIYINVIAMKEDYNKKYPSELLLSWNNEQLSYIKPIKFWKDTFNSCKNAKVISFKTTNNDKEVWNDWIKQNNEYAINDKKAIEANADKYMCFINVILKKQQIVE